MARIVLAHAEAKERDVVDFEIAAIDSTWSGLCSARRAAA